MGQEECYRGDDRKRTLIALIADTYMRLAEGSGVLRSDFIEKNGICGWILDHIVRAL